MTTLLMGQLAIAVRITFDRWQHMLEAKVVLEATVDVVSSHDFSVKFTVEFVVSHRLM